jgi:hypothetical protein
MRRSAANRLQMMGSAPEAHDAVRVLRDEARLVRRLSRKHELSRHRYAADEVIQ